MKLRYCLIGYILYIWIDYNSKVKSLPFYNLWMLYLRILRATSVMLTTWKKYFSKFCLLFVCLSYICLRLLSPWYWMEMVIACILWKCNSVTPNLAHSFCCCSWCLEWARGSTSTAATNITGSSLRDNAILSFDPMMIYESNVLIQYNINGKVCVNNDNQVLKGEVSVIWVQLFYLWS